MRLSRSLCKVVGDVIANSGSHAALDMLFLSSGAPGDPLLDLIVQNGKIGYSLRDKIQLLIVCLYSVESLRSLWIFLRKKKLQNI